MGREEIIYLIPYAGSLGISLGILVYVWKRRNITGATAFFCYLLGQSLYVAGNTLEISTSTLSAKIFWETFQWVVASLPLVAFPIFVIQFTEYKITSLRKIFMFLVIPPILFSLFVTTNDIHHLFYLNPRILQVGAISTLAYDYSLAFIAYSIYIYLVALASVAMLVVRMKQPHGIYRIQIVYILLGLLLPLGGSILSLAGLNVNFQRDGSPLAIALSNLLLAWGVYRFRIFDIMPIGRDKVFEAMVEPVVILDNRGNIVDINSAMLAMLEKKAEQVVGESAKVVFNNFPIPVRQYMQSSYARTEASFERGGMNIHFEMTVWPIYNSRREMTGRIFISHDISALKQLENELRKLNTQLEDRVMARTHELAEAYDTTLEGWARALELRDKETEGHTRRVTDTTIKMAFKLNFPDDMIEHIRRGAILHDIGKMGIPDEILHKPGELTSEEREIVSKHPETAYRLLKPISFLERALDIPYCHHEKWDGTGYPRGLRGGSIPVAARIFAIADVWDALSYERPYNKPWSQEKKIAHFVEQSGKHFDPYMVNIFLDMVENGEI